MLGDVVGGRGGTVVAGYQMAGDLGSLTGPLLAGALADTAGFGAAFGVTAGRAAGRGRGRVPGTRDARTVRTRCAGRRRRRHVGW